MHSTAATPEPGPAVSAIDTHAHVFVRGLPLAAQRRHAPDYDAKLDNYLALLDAHRISHGVLVQPSFLGTDNSFMLAALRACPTRLRGVAVTAPDAGEGEMLALRQAGVCGVRLNLLGLPMPDFLQPVWRNWFARVRALGWHVELHIESRHLPFAGQAVLDAGCRLVVDHFGRPGAVTDAGRTWLLDAAGGGRTWVKLSAAYRNWPGASPTQATDAARTLLERFGAQRLVWGSDWPHTEHRDAASYGNTKAALAAWVPDPSTRHRILAETPADLYNFDTGDKHHDQ
ncbi:MAG: amidohydrolase family protein [Variovorax sp.]